MIELKHPKIQLGGIAENLNPELDGYPPSDRQLFLAGYSELCRTDLNGKRALEICGGNGNLAAKVSKMYPHAEIYSLDLQKPCGADSEDRLRRLPGLSFVAGDALDLSAYDDESFDLLWGQAALHHLAHNHKRLSEEALRILKPGGRLVFIFEPLGHNILFAAIRAARVSWYGFFDESNLFMAQFEEMLAAGFSTCEVQVFNLFGYPLKALSSRANPVAKVVQSLDSWIFRIAPRSLKYGANCNVVFTK